jgi:hypothetical protein
LRAEVICLVPPDVQQQHSPAGMGLQDEGEHSDDVQEHGQHPITSLR